LGYEPGGDDELSALSDDERQQILDDLDKGEISYEEAMKLLQEEEE
jgi:hypothetical protein